jgi:hypothetical protein
MKSIVGFLLLALVLTACGGDSGPTGPAPDRTRAPGSAPAVVSLSEAVEPGAGPTVATDKEDYAPGETVIITGSGWEPGETVLLQFQEDPKVCNDRTRTVVADSLGNFLSQNFVLEQHDLGVTFTLVATGQSSGLTAQTTFTDGNLQVRSGANAPTPNPFSPNGDAVKDTVAITVRNAGAGNVTNVFVRIRQGTGTVASSALVREFSLGTLNQNTDATVKWDGKNTGGTLVADGNYTVRIFSTTVAEAQPEDETNARKATLIVDTTAPVISDADASPASAVSGSATPVTLTAIATDPPATGVAANNYSIASAQYRIDSGSFSSMSAVDGNFNQQIENLTVTIPGATIAGLSVGPHLLCIRATDGVGNRSPDSASGNSNCATLTITSANQPPTANAGGPYPGDEGSAIPISGTASDPDPADNPPSTTWTFEVVSAPTGADCDFADETALSTTVTCNDNGSYKLILTASDGKAAPVSSEATLSVANVDPTADELNAPSEVDEGSSIALSLENPTDDSSNDVAEGLRFAFDCGAGAGYSASDYADASLTNSASCPTDDNGTRNVKGKVFDKDGGSNEYSASVTVKNVPPTADNLNAPSEVDEGSSIALSLENPTDVSSVDAASLKFAFDCDDGAGYSASDYAAASATNSASCPTDDNGTRNVRGKVFDKDGGSNEYTASVTVNNVKPAIQTVTKPDGSALPTQIFVAGTLDLKVPFTDPGTADTHTAEIDCGSGVFSDVNGGGQVTASFTTSCTFGSVGPKTIKLRVTDDDGGTSDVWSYTIGVLYDFYGFFTPVDNNGVMNTANSGQAIPLKFLLKDANGNPILNLSSVIVKAEGYSCALGTTADLIEEYAAGASGLQNHGDGSYQFNWKTPTSYAKSCKTMKLDLGEGTPRTALFQFRK